MQVDKSAAERLWAEVLAEHVDSQGRVNFKALAQRPDKLAQVVSFVEANSPDNHPDWYATPQSVLAYHINAYNALAMYSVIQEGIPEALKGYRFFKFFFSNKVIVGGKPISLYAYENEVIRPLGEPRIHFALNCMSVGCPRLPQVPFKADQLDQQLETEAKRFFNEERNVKIDAGTRSVELSEILKFYTEDFLRVSGSLISFANRYRSMPIPGNYEVRFQTYDWTINRWPDQQS